MDQLTRSRGARLLVTSLLAVALLAVTACGWESGNRTDLDAPPAPATEIHGQAGLDVLLITVDTLRADALGSYGDETAATPWMDALADEGVRFDDARAHNTNTLPSHATILSGLYPFEHGVRDNAGFRFPQGISTLATILGDLGYRTGAFVSAFTLDSQFGLARDFDVYDDGFIDTAAQVAFQIQERPGVETVARALAWLNDDGEGPSLAWVHLFEPHFPYAPPASLAERFQNDPYRGDVAAADAALEPLLRPLLERQGGSQPLVVLTSDHGEALGDHGEPTHGIFAYDSVLRVPLIFYQPDLLPPGVVNSPVRLVDLMPTILDLLAIEPPPGRTGRSLLPVIGSNSEQAPETYFESLSPRFNLGWAPLRGIVEGGWKYIDLPIPELYDLEVDPGEERNLAASEPGKMSELRTALNELTRTDAGTGPSPESGDTRRRLEALGYLGSGDSGQLQAFDESDDPKRLIHLFRELRIVAGLHAAGELEKARSLCREILDQRPGMRVALMYLAQIERDLGNLDVAASVMHEAFELNPNDDEVLALLASYLMQAGQPLEAVHVTEDHSRLERPSPDVMLTRGLAQARLERHEKALGTLQRARDLDPTNPMVPVYIGTFHLMRGDRNRARSSYEEALRVEPETVRAHTSLAIMAGEENRAGEAVEHWRRALEIDPEQHATLFGVAGRLWGAGQRDQARTLLEVFVESAPPERFASEIGHAHRLLGAR